MDYCNIITMEPGKRAGKPCIRGMRITAYAGRAQDREEPLSRSFRVKWRGGELSPTASEKGSQALSGARCTPISGRGRDQNMKTMIYKDYAAPIAYGEEDDCFVGHLAGIRDVVAFYATTVRELRAAFREAVDDYVQACERTGIAPKRPYSGKLMLRLPPGVHAAVATAAEVDGKSLNQWAAKVFERAAAP